MMSVRKTNIIHSNDGGLTILWAFMLPVIIGFIGIGVETSLWYSQKGDLQSATDAASIVTAYAIGSGANLNTAATNEMARNGYGANAHLTLTVNHPPLTGAYTGNSNAVEVIVSEPENALFSAVLGLAQVNLKTRAVSLFTPSTNGGGCVMALNQLQIDTIDINGNVTLNMPGCTMIDNSNASSAVYIGGSSTVTVNNVYTAGGISVNGNAVLNHTISNVTSGSEVPDPFSGLPMPSIGSCAQNNFSAGSGNTTMIPGVYCGNTKFNAQSNVTMTSGTYIINGGSFSIDGQAAVSGSGVTIILTNNATITVNGGANVTLSAPTSGTYAGILFYGDRASANNNNDFTGGATMNLTGIIYMPSETVNFNGNATTGGTCTRIVSYAVNFKGTSYISPTCPAGYPGIPVPTTTGSVKLEE